jgi:hypothetical protein
MRTRRKKRLCAISSAGDGIRNGARVSFAHLQGLGNKLGEYDSLVMKVVEVKRMLVSLMERVRDPVFD